MISRESTNLLAVDFESVALCAFPEGIKIISPAVAVIFSEALSCIYTEPVKTI
ncbi:hypothetical protein D3C76_1539560 [compost metagenome]